MNTLTIVLVSLQSAITAIGLVEGFISNPHIIDILENVKKALTGAVHSLQPHQMAMQEAHAKGEEPPLAKK